MTTKTLKVERLVRSRFTYAALVAATVLVASSLAANQGAAAAEPQLTSRSVAFVTTTDWDWDTAAEPASCAIATPSAGFAMTDRFHACEKSETEIRMLVNGAVRGESTLQVVQWFELANNSLSWTHHVDVKMLSASGVLESGITMQPGLSCQSSCGATTVPDPFSLMPFESQDFQIEVAATPPPSSDSNMDGASADSVHLDLEWKNAACSTDEPMCIGHVYGDQAVSVRCDRATYVGSAAGCVLPAVIPILDDYAISDETVAQVAQHVATAQSRTQWGTLARPLHRLYDDALRKKNRYAACGTTTAPFDDDMANPSCDEFPFASTWEGAYTQEGWTSADDGSTAVVDLTQNRQAGSDLAAFYREQRVLDGDAFLVRVQP